jgi:hypothetical protein
MKTMLLFTVLTISSIGATIHYSNQSKNSLAVIIPEPRGKAPLTVIIPEPRTHAVKDTV